MGSQRLAHVLPEGCRRVFNLPAELLVGAGDGLPEMEAGAQNLEGTSHVAGSRGVSATRVCPRTEPR